MIHRRAVVAVLALCACGKSSKEPSAAEPKATDVATTPVPQNASASTTKTATADKPPAPTSKAPARGPEHAVYSLVDNRLSAHLTRGGGLFASAGSAGFAKYVR